ncbi:hypothetical protein CPB85DRAFT_1253697 [Mucidula mucida]|nr:hypothetical protein CPB85DRAFT_1253697 [Mucidula mucida]
MGCAKAPRTGEERACATHAVVLAAGAARTSATSNVRPTVGALHSSPRLCSALVPWAVQKYRLYGLRQNTLYIAPSYLGRTPPSCLGLRKIQALRAPPRLRAQARSSPAPP